MFLKCKPKMLSNKDYRKKKKLPIFSSKIKVQAPLFHKTLMGTDLNFVQIEYTILRL